nr:retrovirus-related Pol polyprotein from transposon TNT 1-94 [Tanacetum cinerariifolium]
MSDRLCSFRLIGSVSGGIIRISVVFLIYCYILIFKHEAFGKFKDWKHLVENQTGRMVKKLRTDNGLKFCNREFEQLSIESGIARHLTVVRTSQQNGLAERKNRTLMNKTPMEMWSGYPSDYGMLKSFSCVVYPHDKQVTSRNVVFNESVMYKDTLKDSSASDKFIEELQVEVELRREPRTRTKPLRFRDESDMAAYAFVAAEEEDTHEPLTYQETSPKQWYKRFDEYMLNNGFKRSSYNSCVYYKSYAPVEYIYLLLYVDDMLIAYTLKDSSASDKFIEELQVEVELQRLNNHALEEDKTDQEDGDDEDAGDQATDQPLDLTDY